MAKTIRWIGLALLLLSSSVYMVGQATASSALRGTVADTTGAAIIGAEVTVTSAATGATRTVKSGTDGAYVVEPLQAGTYAVKVSMKGFATATAAKVETLVGATTTQNFSLKTGTATEVIEVTSEVPLVDQLKTDVSENITPSQVQQLPMIGRDVANLAYLAPGVKATDSYDPTKNRMAVLSVNGQNGRNVNVTVNGIDNKDATVGGPVMQLPMEAVQEFDIATQRFSAANGRSEGAAINMITMSGTNKYHGSLFANFKDQALNADQKLSDGSKVNPPYTRQWFGGSVGGPFIKDKLFGFFAYERQREHTSLAEDPTSLAELQLAADNGLAAQPAAVLPTPFFETRYNGRMDMRFNDKHTAYISYASQANNSLNDQSDGTGDLTNGNFTVNHMQIANFTLNSAFTPSLVNQFTFGYQYWNNLIDSNISAPLVIFPSASFGTNTNVPQQSYQRKWQFKDDITKTVGKHTFKSGVDYIWEPTVGGFFEFSSTLEIDFKKDPSCILNGAAADGCGPSVYPDGLSTAGLISFMGIANGNPNFTLPGGAKQLGLYFQDDWKVAKRLTLNLGLRWDRDFNLVGSSAVANNATYKELAALNNPLTNPFIKPPHDDSKNFSPRIGFAYDMTGTGKWVLRGGYGLYYGNIFQNIPLFMIQQANDTLFQQSLNLTSSTAVVPGTGKTLGQWRYGVDDVNTIAIPAPSATLSPGSVGRIMDPNYKNPVTEEFNLGTSWQLSNTSAIEVEYVHVLSLHENKTINIDAKVYDPALVAATHGTEDAACCVRPLDAAFAAAGLPRLNSIRDEQSIGRSHYDGVNFSYRQRMSHRFSLNANYSLSWANSFDGGSTSFRNYPRDPRNPFASYEWGPSPNDERHHITISGLVDLGKGFEFAPILQFGTARPYDLTNSYNTLDTGGGTGTAVVVPVNDQKNYIWGTNYINSAIAALGPNPTDSQLAAAEATAEQEIQTCYYTGGCTIAKYDPLRGRPFFQLDTRIAKNFKLGEGRNLQLIAQFLNLTNRANYGANFHNDVSTPSNFGTPAGFINPTSTNIPRSFQSEFGFRFTF